MVRTRQRQILQGLTMPFLHQPRLTSQCLYRPQKQCQKWTKHSEPEPVGDTTDLNIPRWFPKAHGHLLRQNAFSPHSKVLVVFSSPNTVKNSKVQRLSRNQGKLLTVSSCIKKNVLGVSQRDKRTKPNNSARPFFL